MATIPLPGEEIQAPAVEREAGRAAQEPLINRRLALFMLAMILANIAFSMYGTMLPLYLSSLNASVVQVGLFFTLSQILPLGLQILGGWISDSLGRLRSIAMGSLAGMFSYVALVLAPTWQWVLLGEGFGAVTRSLVGPSFSAYIAEQSSEENRARVFGITDTLYMIVAVVGPPLGAWLASGYGFKFMLTCAGLVYTAATVIRVSMARTAARGQEARPQKLSVSSLKTNLSAMSALLLGGGIVTWILLTDGIRDVAFSLSFTLQPLYVKEVGRLTVQQIGWLESIFGIAMMLVTTPAGILADKKGERLAIVIGFLLHGVALGIFLQAGASFLVYALAWVVLGLGAGIMSPAYNSLTSKAIPLHLRGTAFGLIGTSLGLVSLPAPAIGAQLWHRFSPQTPFAITAGLALLAMLPVWFKFKLPEKVANEATSEGSG